MHDIEAVLGLVVLAVAVAALAPRLRTPAPSMLVLVGLGVGFLPGFPTAHVSPDLVTLGVLPPLLFAAAQQISLIDLRQVWRPVAVLALGLVLVTAAAVAAVAHAVVPALSPAVAFTFGAVLASTDPVAVTALSRELRLPSRVATLVQAESLFNDATSLVLFEVAVAAAVGTHVGASDAVGRFFVLAAGGVAAGVIAGLLAGLGLRRADDPTVQTALVLVTPYVAAVGADAFGVSPVTAVIVSGLLLGRRRVRTHHSEGRLLAGSVYEVVVFVLENAIFAVIGLQLASFLHDLTPGDTGDTIALVAAVTVTLLSVRALALAAPTLLPRRVEATTGRRGWPVGVVLTWAGARGVIPLAAALSIPVRTHSGAPFPHRSMLLVVATAVVVVTLVVQGTTLAPLVRRLGVTTTASEAADEMRRARHALALAALDRLDRLAESTESADDVVDRLRRELQQRATATRETPGPERAGRDVTAEANRLRRELLAIETEELARLRLAGEIGSETFRHVQRQLDIEHTRLAQ